MKKLAFLIVCIFISPLLFSKNNADLVSRVKFASQEKGRELLSTEDDYTNKWSRFDIESRMQKKGTTKEELLAYIAEQVQHWTEEEKLMLQESLNRFDSICVANGYNLDFPEEIYFVKTNGKDESGAVGYTRGNYVVINGEEFGKYPEMRDYIVFHELFHILTRHNPAFRKKMYKLIGFETIEDVEYPEELKDIRMSNPDTPFDDCYISLKKEGKPVDCLMIMYAKDDYDGGNFFNYLQIAFLEIEVSDGKGKVKYVDGELQIYGLQELGGLLEQIGYNSQYILHAEEILADNFSMVMLDKQGLPSEWLKNDIIELLKK